MTTSLGVLFKFPEFLRSTLYTVPALANIVSSSAKVTFFWRHLFCM